MSRALSPAQRIGELDQLITIQREVLTDDGMGGQTQTLTTLVSDLWAKARALSGREMERYDKVNATAMVTFIVRNEGDAQSAREDDRIVWQSTDYNIRYIAPTSGRDLYLMMEAEKGVAQ